MFLGRGEGSERNVHATFLVTKSICECSLNEIDPKIKSLRLFSHL